MSNANIKQYKLYKSIIMIITLCSSQVLVQFIWVTFVQVNGSDPIYKISGSDPDPALDHMC